MYEGGGEKKFKKWYARVIESLDGILDPFGAEGERAVWQSRRARDTFEFRHALRLLTVI